VFEHILRSIAVKLKFFAVAILLAFFAGSASLPTIISDDTGSRAIASRSFTTCHDTG